MTTTEGDKHLLEKIPQHLESVLGLKNANFEVISWIPLLYQGWELDPWAVVIRLSDGKKLLITTDHGSLKIIDEAEKFLMEFDQKYNAAAQKCLDALKNLRGSRI